MNFDKLFGGVSTASGAIGLALTLGISIAFIWAIKNRVFSSPDASLMDTIKSMVGAVKENTTAVKKNSGHVQDQLKQFEDSNELIASMVVPLKNISTKIDTLSGDIHDEIIRKEASR